MAELDNKTVETIAALARSTGAVVSVEGGNFPFAVIPKDAQLVPLERHIYNGHNERPERVEELIEVSDPASFIEYFKQFSDAHSRIFADEPEARVTAFLDYHEAMDKPRWCDHQVDLVLAHSNEWTAWTGKNNQQMSQMAFAEFLEQHAADITSPPPAAIIDVCRDLQAKSEVEFGGGSRVESGAIRFRYSETVRATVGAGNIDVPSEFTIAIPVFCGGTSVPLQALLRYRLNNCKLILFFTLVRPDEAARAAFAAARGQIAEALGVTILNGKRADEE